MSKSEALSGRLTPSEAYPKGKAPPPLRLGGVNGRVHLTAEVNTDGLDIAHLTSGSGEQSLNLSRRGAIALARWLEEWARPRTRIKLWGSAEIQKAYGISRPTLGSWRKHKTFPRPLAELAAGPVWEANAVRTWVRLDRPGPGRTPKRKGSRR